MRTCLKWRNKFSGEEGFVKSVSKAKGYFTNTWDANEAKEYKGTKTLEKDLLILTEVGETENNEFFTVQL